MPKPVGRPRKPDPTTRLGSIRATLHRKVSIAAATLGIGIMEFVEIAIQEKLERDKSK